MALSFSFYLNQGHVEFKLWSTTINSVLVIIVGVLLVLVPLIELVTLGLGWRKINKRLEKEIYDAKK